MARLPGPSDDGRRADHTATGEDSAPTACYAGPAPHAPLRYRVGHTVPGFPAHPHRGFETITILRRGVIDHSDSLGASARFGAGDVQLLTAGPGIICRDVSLARAQRSQPFGAVSDLNLPARHKMVEPNFTMFWAEDIPPHVTRDADGTTEVLCVAGTPSAGMGAPPAPPPNSWAARSDCGRGHRDDQDVPRRAVDATAGIPQRHATTVVLLRGNRADHRRRAALPRYRQISTWHGLCLLDVRRARTPRLDLASAY
jgi:Pirin